MNKKKKIEELNSIFPIRIIPIDFGYQISKKHINKVKSFCKKNNFKYFEQENLLGITALLKITIDNSLVLYLFKDGIGVYVFYDEKYFFESPNDINPIEILKQRKKCHNDILNGIHIINSKCNIFNKKIKKLKFSGRRRLTSSDDWENSGFSYVMSVFFFNMNTDLIQSENVRNKICNILYTDNYNYNNNICSDFSSDRINSLLNNQDVVSDTHVCVSWASVIVIGKNIDFKYYIDLEIVLQHIWMYSYITDKNIDYLLLKDSDKYSSKEFKKYYQTIIEMTLLVKKYDSIFNSTIHDRDYRLLNSLRQSSKLECLEKNIDIKLSLLKDKMNWSINRKNLKSDRNIEIFIIILTLIQVLTSFNMTLNDILKFPVILILGIIIIGLIIYRNKF